MSNEEKRHSSLKVEGRTELDLVQDEVDGEKRSLEEAHLEVQAVQNKAIEAAFQVGQAMEKCPRSRNCWRRTWSQPVNEDRSEDTFVGQHHKGKYHVGKMV